MVRFISQSNALGLFRRIWIFCWFFDAPEWRFDSRYGLRVTADTGVIRANRNRLRASDHPRGGWRDHTILGCV